MTWVGMILFILFLPLFLPMIGLSLLHYLIMRPVFKYQVVRLRNKRQGESIGSFARSFNYRAIDTWVIRAVYEELEWYCTYDDLTFPLRATDDLDELGIDPDDFEDIIEDIAFRTGRSLEGYDKNPFYMKLNTVKDLVLFFVNQPFKNAA